MSDQKAIESAEYLFGFVGRRVAEWLLGSDRTAEASDGIGDLVPTSVVLEDWAGVCWPTLRKMIKEGYFPEPDNPESRQNLVWCLHDLEEWQAWTEEHSDNSSYKIWRRSGAEKFTERGLSC